MRTHALTLAFVCVSSLALAQEPVSTIPDAVSWGTAFVNPAIAAAQAWKSERRGCRLGQLAIS